MKQGKKTKSASVAYKKLTIGFIVMFCSNIACDLQAGSFIHNDVSRIVAETLGTKKRTVPQTKDFHEAFNVANGYPAYNASFKSALDALGGTDEEKAARFEEQKAAVYAENLAILDYTSLDVDGNLYKNGIKKVATEDGQTVTNLVRHTAGVSNYGEAIPDDALSTTKRISLRMVRYGNVVTGLYAPPGEVVKITFGATSSNNRPQDLGLLAQIGNFSGNNHNPTIPATRDYTRMPVNGISLALDQQTNYVGSPLGGAILIYSSGIGGTTVEMTIEGAVEMPVYEFGTTTHEELAEQFEKPGPYFAFTTPRGLRAVGPASLVRGLDAAKVIKAMDFWDKAIGVAYQFETDRFDQNDPDTNYMLEMFDPHIPAGAACNMGEYCICPVGWGVSFFDGDAIMGDSPWGCIHELNHSYYWGGASDSSVEIANNVISALVLQLYTNIAANRTESGGLSGWNWCTDYFTSIENIRKSINNWANLGVYVPVQHAFGADCFINAVHEYHVNGGVAGGVPSGTKRLTNANIWLYASSIASDHDMTYYMRDVLKWHDGSGNPPLFPEYEEEQSDKRDYLTSDVIAEIHNLNLPLYIPCGCLYSSGVAYGQRGASKQDSYLAAVVAGEGVQSVGEFAERKNVIEMGRPFRIPFGVQKYLNFNASSNGGFVSVANGEDVELVGYTSPEHGKLTPTTSEMVLSYRPDTKHLYDSFFITLKLTVTDQDSSFCGQSEYVTFKISLLQDTTQSGFSTMFYEWSNILNTLSDPVGSAVESGVLDGLPSSQIIGNIAGFQGAKEKVGSLAVVNGRLMPECTGDWDLYVRGNVYFNTCVAGSEDELPDAAQAQSKVLSRMQSYSKNIPQSRLHVYVVPEGGSEPSDTSDYDAVINEGNPLLVRAYVVIPYDCTGYYRIGQSQGSSINEFSAEQVQWELEGELQTPAIHDFSREKAYSYPDPSVMQDYVYGDFTPLGAPISVSRAWDLTKDRALAAYSGTYANIVDESDALDSYGFQTMFHGYVNPSKSYEAEFVFTFEELQTFNMICYRGHNNPSMTDRGKIKDYELYVGDDYDALLAATAESNLCVQKGVANKEYDYGNCNKIMLDGFVTGKYVRLVARSAYPSNGQYYYAFSDFKIGTCDVIYGKWTLQDGYTLAGDWVADESLNSRVPVMTTSSGEGEFTFSGSGVLMCATMNPSYKKMSVTLYRNAIPWVLNDVPEVVDATEIDLSDSRTIGQRIVYRKSGLDALQTYTLHFKPQSAGDLVNVECFGIMDYRAPEETASIALSVEGDANATVLRDADGVFVVKPSEGIKDIKVVVPNDIGASNVVVEVSSEVGTIDLNGAALRVMANGSDITPYLEIHEVAGGVIEMSNVAVKDAIIKEALDTTKGAVIKIDPETPLLTTSETRIGLTYTLLEGLTLPLGENNRGDSKIGDGSKWTPRITVKGGTSGFYTIQVEK